MTSPTTQERREKRRFPLALEFSYNSRLSTGTGTTLDIGSGGCVASVTQRLEAKRLYRLDIQWPALLHEKIQLILRVNARLDWIKDTHAGFRFLSKGEFFTRRTEQMRIAS